MHQWQRGTIVRRCMRDASHRGNDADHLYGIRIQESSSHKEAMAGVILEMLVDPSPNLRPHLVRRVTACSIGLGSPASRGKRGRTRLGRERPEQRARGEVAQRARVVVVLGRDRHFVVDQREGEGAADDGQRRRMAVKVGTSAIGRLDATSDAWVTMSERASGHNVAEGHREDADGKESSSSSASQIRSARAQPGS